MGATDKRRIDKNVDFVDHLFFSCESICTPDAICIFDLYINLGKFYERVEEAQAQCYHEKGIYNTVKWLTLIAMQVYVDYTPVCMWL